jgi:phage gp36-like protein
VGLVGTPSQYAQPADLQSVGLLGTFLQLVPVPSQVQALQNASAIMDGYIGQRFILPIVTWGFDIQMHCCWLAAFILIQQRGYNPQNPAEKTWEERYDKAMAWLKDVSNGKATPSQVLDSSPNAQPGASAPQSSPQVVSPGLAAGVVPPTWGTNWRGGAGGGGNNNGGH